MIGKIDLTPDEEDVFSRIVFDLDAVMNLDYEQSIENGELSAALIKRLVSRDAIPEVRRLYLEDEDYNPGKGKGSRKDNFLNNSGTVANMVRHAHFLPYLHYFVCGADLPIKAKEEFFARAQDYWVKSDELIKLAKQQVRARRVSDPPARDYLVADAYYQLALDSGCDESVARLIRAAVKTIKSAKG